MRTILALSTALFVILVNASTEACQIGEDSARSESADPLQTVPKTQGQGSDVEGKPPVRNGGGIDEAGGGFFPSGGLGGGLGGLGGGFSPGGAGQNPGRQIQGKNVIIAWSEGNDELRGFSGKTGDWEVLKIEPQTKLQPTVGFDIAGVRLKNAIAAFSPEKCSWDVLPLTEGSKAVPTVGFGLATFSDNGHFYTFSNEKGRWTSPTDPELQPGSKSIDGPDTLKVGGEFNAWANQLPKYKRRLITSNIRRGKNGDFGFNVDVQRQSLFKEVVAKLDELSSKASEDSNSPRSTSQERDEVADLREEERHLLKTLSRQASGKLSRGDRNAQEIRKLVEQSFDLRQKLQRLEVEQLQLKLQRIESQLKSRENSREQIIQKRIEELSSDSAG